MLDKLDCSWRECWQVLLDVTQPPEQREFYERHVESCPVCQDQLDRCNASGERLQQLARRIGDPTIMPTDPTLVQVVHRLLEEPVRARNQPAASADLYFLQPSDQEGVLGTLDSYEVREVIGQGGMGIVLKAFDPQLKRVVAIKVLSPALAGSVTGRRRFTREAQTAATVCHPNIVVVHSVSEAEGLPYLVMQYIAGESLQARLERTGPLETAEIVRIGRETAAGLAAAHAQGLIHRDIKPANLLLEMGNGEWGIGNEEKPSAHSPFPIPHSPFERVKITDFGLARLVDDVGLTQNGVVAGTPEYMAPEQARGELVDHRADLFSLGSVLYALCTGVPPFCAATPLAVLRQVSDTVPCPVRSLNPEVPAWLEALITRLMVKDPAGRYQSAAEVAALLDGYLDHLDQPATVAPPEFPPLPPEACAGPPSSHFRGRPATWLRRPRLAALGALAALGVCLFLLLQAAPPLRGGRSLPSSLTLQGPDEDKAKNLAGWGAVTDPSGDCTFTAEKSRLVIKVPGGNHNLNPNRGMQAPRVLKIVKGDFVAQIKVTGDFKPGEKAANNQRSSFNGAGLLVWQDEKNYIRLERNRWYVPAAQKYACFTPLLEYYKNGEYQDTGLDSTLDEFFKGRSTWLRLERKGDKVIASYSHDGNKWNVAKEIAVDLSAELSVGVAAINTSEQAFTVEFDEYKVEGNAGPSEDGEIRSGPASILGWLARPVGVVGLILGLPCALFVLLHLRRWARTSPSPGVPVTREGGEEKPGPADHEAAAPLIAFACPGCGKKLRARPDLAGKKVKCPRCGQAVLITETDPGSLAPRASTARFSILKNRKVVASVLVLAVVAGVCSWLFWPRQDYSFLNGSLGNQFVPEVQESGFYEEEYGKAGEPFRWTDGKGRLVIPIDRRKPPAGLVVELDIYRPAAVKTAWVQIVANNRELIKQQVPLWEWQGSSAGKFSAKSLDLTGIDLGDELVLDIISDTFIPKTDKRTLGVLVKGVHVLHEAPAPQ